MDGSKKLDFAHYIVPFERVFQFELIPQQFVRIFCLIKSRLNQSILGTELIILNIVLNIPWKLCGCIDDIKWYCEDILVST